VTLLLSTERDLLERALPGFDKRLADMGAEVDLPGSEIVEEFRAVGGGNLLLPAEIGGAGLGCLDGVRVQRAIGSRSPSLAVASTMHHYKVAWLARELDGPLASAVLGRVAAERLLVASCGAEGRAGGELFTPGIQVTAVPGGLSITGSKRPCSLAGSMGLLSLLAAGPEDSRYRGQLVNVMIPADAPGIRREPFWGNRVLQAAETSAVVLDGVHVPDPMIIPVGDPAGSAPQIVSNMLWFQLLITAAYVGVATGQVERLLLADRGTPGDRVAALAPLETVTSALEAAAMALDAGRFDENLLGQVLLIRYTAQRAIAEATDRVLELRGGMAFVTSCEGSDALLSSRGLAFHPPAEIAMRGPIDRWLHGEGLTLA
jgi:alkylation response protein AidB-like acyl-CoA dehydrogenase